MATPIWETQYSLNVLANTVSGLTTFQLEAQKAANVWAGTAALNLELQMALNFKYRGVTTWAAFYAPGNNYQVYDAQRAANLINGTTTMELQDALSDIAGGGHSNAT